MLNLLVFQGHGTLHAIYASIQKTCAINNWTGVDLVIIGGDFQVHVHPIGRWKTQSNHIDIIRQSGTLMI